MKRRKAKFILVVTALFGFAFVLTGCSAGPLVLRSNRAAYNQAVHRSVNEQLLLNIVRLKYREPLTFLQIGSISSHFDYSASASVTGTWPDHAPDSYGAGLGGSYSDQPTLTYTPMEGKEFATRLLMETDASTFIVLVRAGWRIDHLMRMLVHRIGNLQNYPTAPHTDGTPGDYQKFLAITQTWQTIHQRGDLRFLQTRTSPNILVESIPPEKVSLDALGALQETEYRIAANADGTYRLETPGETDLILEVCYPSARQADTINQYLGIQPNRTELPDGRIVDRIELIPVHESPSKTARERNDDLPIQLRSFSDVLYYVAQGVETPEDHRTGGLTKTYTDQKGRVVDRRNLTRDLLDVRCSALPPRKALTSVYFRNRWFYVPDTDVDSKDAFALLSIIFALQSKEQSSPQPLLTIPVAN